MAKLIHPVADINIIHYHFSIARVQYRMLAHIVVVKELGDFKAGYDT
ncbi:hypothetical protein ACFLYQ_05800 [Chloroflexota bacterium]